jgi:DNA primase
MTEQHIEQTTGVPAGDEYAPSFYMFAKRLDVLKDAVRIETYAAELTELTFTGQSLRGRCPVHGGENRSSFAVYPDKQRWHCFRCNEGGDVLDLCQTVEGHDALWTVMLSLAQRYNVGLPERPKSWYVRQDEKAKVRAQVLEVLVDAYQRRLFRVYGDIILDGIEDPAEREEEARNLFRGLRRVARAAARNRMARHA